MASAQTKKPNVIINGRGPSKDTKWRAELVVEMTCGGCAKTVDGILKTIPGVASYTIDVEQNSVLVEGTVSALDIQKELDESGGFVVAFRGFSALGKHLGAIYSAVRGIDSHAEIMGVTRMVQISEEECWIEADFDGLSPGPHGVHLHEYGDIREGPVSCGDHYNPTNQPHGSPEGVCHVGDLGNIVADEKGHAELRMISKQIKAYEMIGRSIVIDEEEDTFAPNSPLGKGIAVGILSRASGVLQNPKKVCSCDGTTIWENIQTR